MDNRVVFHYNKSHNLDQTIPPWVIKAKGKTYYVHHFTTEVGFSTKETPDNPHTKGSLMMRGTVEIIEKDGITEAIVRKS